MVQTITLQESLWFSAVALLLGLITMRFRPELRRSMTVTLFIIVLGLAGLALLSRYQLIPAQLTIAVVPREICLLIVAIGIIRVFITFITSVLLARRAVPRILGEVSLAVALVVYALFRMDALGVNLTAISVSAAALTAIIGFAAQATLGNLLGGISLQLDNTCRIGDWIEIDGVTGEVVSIRWRYTALATVNNVTIVIPNAELMKNRVTLIGRRGDLRIPWRRPIEFGVGYEWTPGQVLAVVHAALERGEIPFVATEPIAHCVCAGFDQSAIKYIVYYGPTDIITRQGEPSDSLYILARGQVGIFRDAAPGSSPARPRLATLAAPAYFGEMGLLTGQARTATILGESEVLCYRLDKTAFEAIIQARPELAEAMSRTVVERQAANDATLASLSAEARARATGTRAGELLRKIRQFFGLENTN